MRIDKLGIRFHGRGIRRAQERKRALRVAQDFRKPLVSVGKGLHGICDLGVGEREVVLHPDCVLANYSKSHELTLERVDVDVAKAHLVLHALRGRKPRGIALVLHVGLHAQHRHRIAMRAHAETCDEKSVCVPG